jgi:membrane associated rhomboid family serine protease
MRNAWYEINSFLGRFLSPAVRVIFLVNVLITLLYTLCAIFSEQLSAYFYLLTEIPSLTIGRFFFWQFFTYMFVHFETFHLLANMLGLWFFAPRLEYTWGTRKFLSFYFITGIGAGLLHALVAYSKGTANIPMLGASGAIYGVLLAYAMRWPNDTVLLYFVIPIKIKYLAIILGLLAFFGSVGGTQPNISHAAHLGGLLVAFLYLQISDRITRRPPPRTRFNHPDFYN